AKSQEFGDFVVSFSGSVVAGLAKFAVVQLGSRFGASSLLCSNFVKDCVAAGNNEAYCRQFWNLACLMSFQKNGVDMAFEMVHWNERLVKRMRERLSISDSDKE